MNSLGCFPSEIPRRSAYVTYVCIYKSTETRSMTIIRRYRMVRTTLKMTTIQMYLAIFLTMLPIMVTALPVKSLTRDNVAKPNKNDIKIVVSI